MSVPKAPFERRFPVVSVAGYHSSWLDVETSLRKLQSEAEAILGRIENIREMRENYFSLKGEPPTAFGALDAYTRLVEGVEHGLTALQLTLEAQCEADDDGDE